MLRFIWVIVSCVFLIMYYVPKMSYYARHPEKYGEDVCYQMAQIMCNHVRKRAVIKTVATGMENLPKEGGYIMYANHQGKYDVLGVIVSHDKPITYVMDAKRSKLFIADQLTDLLKAQRLDKENIKQQVKVINDVSTEIKAGRRYILFPEGGYDHSHNELKEFMPGSFKIAKKAKVPIVVSVVRNTREANKNMFKRHSDVYLKIIKVIPYDDIANLKTNEIGDIVYKIMIDKI